MKFKFVAEITDKLLQLKFKFFRRNFSFFRYVELRSEPHRFLTRTERFIAQNLSEIYSHFSALKRISSYQYRVGAERGIARDNESPFV